MNRRVVLVGCGSVGLGIARALVDASRLDAHNRVVIIDNKDEPDSVLVRDEDGTTRIDELNTDELQLLVEVRGRSTFSRELVLTARDFICAPEWTFPDVKWESHAERQMHWRQSRVASNRKFQSMQAKARRR